MLGTKKTLRAQVSESRSQTPTSSWAAEDERRTQMLRTALTGLDPSATVAAYCSITGEPSTHAIIDFLHSQHRRVLLPVLGHGIAWGWFTGWQHMEVAWRGIRQPVGRRLGPDALREADIILTPCLAVGLDGTRLGTGGGWYDRALAHRRPGVPVIALARDAEVFPTVPTEPHDLPIDAVATPSGLSWLRAI